MSAPTRYWLAWIAVLGVAMAALGWAVAAVEAQERPPRSSWELAPYRVHIHLLVPADGDVPSPAELGQRLAQRCAAVYGPAWRLSVTHEWIPAGIHELPSPQPAAASAALAESTDRPEKQILVRLGADDLGLNIRAQEFDRWAGLSGPPVSLDAIPHDGLDEVLFRAVAAAFGPVVRIEQWEGNRAVVRFRAARLRTPATWVAPVGGTLVFRPVILRQQGEPASAEYVGEVIPLTLLTLDAVDPSPTSPATCRVRTGLQRLPELRYNGRTQFVAVGARNVGGQVELRFRDAQRPERRLSDLHVYAQAADSDRPRWIGQPDAQGRIVLLGGPLEIVRLAAGRREVAAAPVAPGWDRRIEIEVNVDSGLAQAGPAVERLSDDLWEWVARRELLLGEARRMVAARRLDQALPPLDEAAGLSRDAFLRRLDEQRVKIELNDRALQSEIDAQLRTLREVAEKYLDPTPIAHLRASIERIRAEQ